MQGTLANYADASEWPVTGDASDFDEFSDTEELELTNLNSAAVGSHSSAFKLTATKTGITKNAYVTVKLYNYRFFGVLSTATPTEAQIEGLSKELSNSIGKTFTVNAANQYIYYAYRSALGNATFTSQLGDIDMVQSTMTITNEAGFAETYKIYRTQYSVFGGFTLTVS